MTRVLITGGAGFVGLALARYLASKSNYEIVLADNLSRGRFDQDLEQALNEQTNIHFQQCDLMTQEGWSLLGADFDYVYHLAAVIGVKNVMAHPDRVLSANTMLVFYLLNTFKGSKRIKKIFFSSTSEVYAGAVKHYNAAVPSSEVTPLVLDDIKQMRTTYALSKMVGESACFVYFNQYELPVVIGRYHNVYGPRMGFAHVIPETFQKIARSLTVDVPSADHTRAFCYIDDALDMTVRMTEDSKTVGEIFNIGNSSQEISVGELVKLMASVLGKDIRINPLPATPGSPARRSPDITSWEARFGEKTFVSLKVGLEKTYAWYQNKLNESEKINA